MLPTQEVAPPNTVVLPEVLFTSSGSHSHQSGCQSSHRSKSCETTELPDIKVKEPSSHEPEILLQAGKDRVQEVAQASNRSLPWKIQSAPIPLIRCPTVCPLYWLKEPKKMAKQPKQKNQRTILSMLRNTPASRGKSLHGGCTNEYNHDRDCVNQL